VLYKKNKQYIKCLKKVKTGIDLVNVKIAFYKQASE